MSRVDAANALGLVAAVALSLGAGLWDLSTPEGSPQQASLQAEVLITERDGQRGIVDASGYFFPLGDFQRVVSASLVADDLVLALCEPERVVAYSAHAGRSTLGYRFGDRRLPSTAPEAETLLALRPDLVLVNNLSSQPNLRRMRDTGLPIFDLGHMRGLETLLPNIRTVATLLGHARAGAVLADAFALRMRALAERVPESERLAGLYVGIHGDKMYGGTKGTSYADVLLAAGLRDVAAKHFVGWPGYTSEQLLQLDPQVIVTQTGMAERLCRTPGLAQLRACRGRGRLVEIASPLLLDPGLDMALAAETLQRAIYGAP